MAERFWRQTSEEAPSPESEDDDAWSNKRPRVTHDDEAVTCECDGDECMPDASPVTTERPATETPATIRISSRYPIDLDALATHLVEEERAEATRRVEAASAAEVAATAPAPTDDVFGGDSYTMIDFSLHEAPQSTAPAPTADAPNKKLDLSLIAKHLEASLPSVEYVSGRKVVLLLGNTGAGKSLLLQACAGRKIVRRSYAPGASGAPVDAMEVVPPVSVEERWVWDVEDPLEDFRIGHEQASETKCIRHYARDDDSVVYLDAPGYEDTAGVEVDIATSIAFKKVAERCDALRFVVLVDCHTFDVDRGGAMRRVATLVSTFVRKFSANPITEQRLAFTFIFTKTDALGAAEDRATALANLKRALTETLCGTSDGDVKDVLNWMANCIHFKHPFVDVYHPALSDVAAMRTSIESFVAGRVSSAITSPRADVRCGLTPKAESQIKLDLETHLDELRVALGDGRAPATGASLLHTFAFLNMHVDKLYVHEAHRQAVAAWSEYGTKVALRDAYEHIDSGLFRAGDGPFTLEQGHEAMRSLAVLRLFEQNPEPALPPKPAETALAHLRNGLAALDLRMQEGLELASAGPMLDATSVARSGQTFADSVAALQRLRVWAQVHVEFMHVADEAEAAMRRHQAKLVELATSNAAAEPRILVPALTHLAVCATNARGEPEAGFDAPLEAGVARLDALAKVAVDEAMAALDGAKVAEVLAGEVVAEAATEAMVEDERLNPSLDRFRAALARVEEVKALLANEAAHPAAPLAAVHSRVAQARLAILHHAKRTLQKLSGEVDKVVEACDECGLVAPEGVEGLDASLRRLNSLLATIQPLVNVLTPEQHAECHTAELYVQAVVAASAPARRLLARTQERCERELLRELSPEPLPNPTAHATALAQLASCAWIDARLAACGHETEAFVQAGVAKIHAQFVQFAERATRTALKLYNRYLGNCDGDAGRVHESEAAAFVEASSVLRQLSQHADLTESIPQLGVELQKFVDGVSAAANRWRGDGSRFASALKADRGALTAIEASSAADIDEALGVCRTTMECGVTQESLVGLEQKLRERLVATSAALVDLFGATPGPAEERSAALLALHTLRAKDFPRLTELLPDIEQFRKRAIDEVQAKATAARDAVSQSAGDADTAAAALSELAATAHAFRDFDFGQSAVQTAVDLRQTLDLRCAKLDETLQESLTAGRFAYVREYISPLLGSADPLKKEKLSRTLVAAKDTLQRIFESASASVTDALLVAEAIGRLDDAGKHLDKALSEQLHYDVPALSATLKERVVARLQRHIDDLEAAVEAQRFADVVEGSAVTRDYLHAVAQLMASGPAPSAPRSAVRRRQRHGGSGPSIATEQVIPAEDPHAALNARAEVGLDRADACLAGVDKLARALVAHFKSQQLGRDTFTTTPLSNTLSKLKVAADVGGSKPETAAMLMDRYEAVTKLLAQELSTKLEEVQKQAEGEQLVTFGLKVFGYVAAELRGGLQNHVTLTVNVQASIAKLKAMEDNAADRMDSSKFSVAYFDATVRPHLDKLQRRVAGLFGWWKTKEYEKAKHDFGTQLLQLLEETHAHALRTRRYELARQGIAVLLHIFDSSPAHFESSPGKQARTTWSATKQAILSDFCSLCKRVKGALAQGDARNLELGLRQLHASEEGLSGVDAGRFKSEAQSVHETVHRWVAKEVKTLLDQLDGAYELGAATEAVSRLREVGRVLVSTWALYVELADAAQRHLKTDIALARIAQLCAAHFGGEAHSKLGVSYALLELEVSATKTDVIKAYKAMSKRFHPDKRAALPAGPNGHEEPAHAMQQRVQNAKDLLEPDAARLSFQRGIKAPFADEIRRVPTAMLERLERMLKEGEYEEVRQELVALSSLRQLLALVDGTTKSEQNAPGKRAKKAVQAHMQQIRADLGRLWEGRQFKELNNCLNAVDAADKALSAYEDFYDASWARMMRGKVEEEIETIAEAARRYMHGKSEEGAEVKLKDFALKLIMLGRILDELPRFKDFCRQKMAGLLDSIHEQGSWSYCYVFKLGMLLGQGKVGELDSSGKVVAEDDRIGKTIVSEFKHFKDVTTMVWNEEVTQREVGAVVADAVAWRVERGVKREVPLEGAALTQGFEIYEKEYQRCFDLWSASRLTPDELAQQTVTAALAVQPGSSLRWDASVVAALPTLLARVFCYFTISKSGESYSRLLEQADKFGDDEDACSGMNMDNVLLKPHCTQVLTVLQMLGYGAASGALQRQLMQIRTGEGKSIILGACSTVLALLGFRVRCVCYSDYLSGRDYELFRELFDSFGVLGLVSYSTIGDYSEDVTKRKGDIRALTAALLLGQAMPEAAASSSSAAAPPRPALPPGEQPMSSAMLEGAGSTKAKGKKRSAAALAEPAGPGNGPPPVPGRAAAPTQAVPEILLVDEVDIFFGKDFYGQTHNQVVQLDVPEAVGMLHAVWRLKGASSGATGYGGLLRAAKASAEYLAMLRRFPAWHDVIEREVEAMCADALCHDDPKPQYDRALDKLGYKVMDGIDYDNAVYRYRTAFAHLHHAGVGTFRDPDAALKRALKLQVPCGRFSYANIQPECILGVSGTLEALGDYELQVMERYGIQLYASMPSVYGETQLKFDHAGGAIHVEPSVDGFHRKITDEANHKIRNGRAIIVFFKAGRLEAYCSSGYFKKVLQANVLHEGLDSKTRDYVIRKAATHGQATFASEAFGRGTDFFCKDSKLTNAGGVHVLQTFLALNKAVEVQIQGRTARQGKQGTYALVLLQQDLSDKFKLSSLDGVAQRDIYGTLERARIAVHATGCMETETALAEATRMDKLTHVYFDAVLKAGGVSQRSAAVGYLQSLYRELRPKDCAGRSVDLCIVMDCTGSMGAWISQAHSKSLELVRYIQDEKNLEVRVAFVAYRDHCDGGDRLHTLDFIDGSDPRLQSFISSRCSAKGGGDHPEDVAGGLNAALRLSWSDAPNKLVCHFADAPAHGRKYCDSTDNYPRGCPLGLDPQELVEELASQVNANFYFINCEVDSSTAKMVRIFREIYERFPDRDFHEYQLGTDSAQFLSTMVETVARTVELSHTGRR